RAEWQSRATADILTICLRRQFNIGNGLMGRTSVADGIPGGRSLEGRRSMAGRSRLAGRFLMRIPRWPAGLLLMAGVVIAYFAIGCGGAAGADDKKQTTPKSGKVAVEKGAAEVAKDGDEAPANSPESDKSKARMGEMRRLAASLQVTVGEN